MAADVTVLIHSNDTNLLPCFSQSITRIALLLFVSKKALLKKSMGTVCSWPLQIFISLLLFSGAQE